MAETDISDTKSIFSALFLYWWFDSSNQEWFRLLVCFSDRLEEKFSTGCTFFGCFPNHCVIRVKCLLDTSLEHRGFVCYSRNQWPGSYSNWNIPLLPRQPKTYVKHHHDRMLLPHYTVWIGEKYLLQTRDLKLESFVITSSLDFGLQTGFCGKLSVFGLRSCTSLFLSAVIFSLVTSISWPVWTLWLLNISNIKRDSVDQNTENFFDCMIFCFKLQCFGTEFVQTSSFHPVHK